MRNGTPSTSTGAVSSSGPITNATRYVDIGIVSAKRTRTRPSPSGFACHFRTVRDREKTVGDLEGDPEHRLELGFVETRERPASVGRLELRGREGPRSTVVVDERAAVEPDEAGADLAAEAQGQGRGAGCQGTGRLHRDPLRLGPEGCHGIMGNPSLLEAYDLDLEIVSIEDDGRGRFGDVHLDRDLARERGRVQVRCDGEVVAAGGDPTGQAPGLGHGAISVMGPSRSSGPPGRGA